ncbi:MAG: hypothetical protein HQL52_05750 [Magnetococcales bacterium]|nr:hypothetical protein [Magnetococcales bacterium]
MDFFFREHQQELSQLQTHLQQLQKTTGIRGINLEYGKVYLAKSESLSINNAIQRFSEEEGKINQALEMEEALGLKNAYLLDDDSFWLIFNEGDILGADFGFLHEGNKPLSSYRILNHSRPMPTAKGWYLIKL